jgi:phosphoglycerol transferase
LHKNAYRNVKYFFSNVKCLPEILKEEGYRTYVMQGSDLKFAGHNKFFTQHGMDEIYGLKKLKKLLDIKEEHTGNWGINDHTLINYAKQKLLSIANKKSPFLFSLQTIDTHQFSGFLNKKCEKAFDNELKDVLKCSDQLIFEFIEWIKSQDFYPNTTIVILGDHLAMPNALYDDILKNDKREIINVFINSLKKPDITNISFSTFDMMPTLLESIGGEIDNHRLGLGTSLHSGKKTLVGIEGLDKFNNNINSKSRLYESLR